MPIGRIVNTDQNTRPIHQLPQPFVLTSRSASRLATNAAKSTVTLQDIVYDCTLYKMAPSEDLIDFTVIEDQKENIQSIPSGRSAKALASLFSPTPAGRVSTPSHTRDLNEAIRHEYEKELLSIADSDDPLDIYDRYVRWTLDAYPSAQATPQSQLLPLLERATKAFLSSTHYKNDPRYLKLWLHYIRLFSDSPRETFAYLARHGIGENLALFYEEFAAWLENNKRWSQAEEVYNMGMEKEARPVERLARKFGEFRQRHENTSRDAAEPSSPALPTVRPALAAKVDPFSSTPSPAVDPQAASRSAAPSTSRSGKPKLSVFSDSDEQPKPGSSGSSKGWESIGSVTERKKENTVEARPWAGETLKGGKRNTGVPKMSIFKDEVRSRHKQHTPNIHIYDHRTNDWPLACSCMQSAPKSVDESQNAINDHQRTTNPKTGRVEQVFVLLEAIYPQGPDSSVEYCFEELRARHRGWLNRDWRVGKKPKTLVHEDPEPQPQLVTITMQPMTPPKTAKEAAAELAENLEDNLKLSDENNENAPPSQEELERVRLAKKLRKEERANRTRKIKVMAVKESTQTVKTNLNSPTKPKLKRKKSQEQPTMTICTKEAMDDIYEIFNQPLAPQAEETDDGETGEESDDDDEDEYTSAGESTGTGRISATTSEFGDDTAGGDFTEHKVAGEESDEEETANTDAKSVSEWSDFNTEKHVPKHEDVSEADEAGSSQADHHSSVALLGSDLGVNSSRHEEITTPTSPEAKADPLANHFMPPTPEDFQMPSRCFRDPAVVANNRLPFMTPIVEKTESSLGAATALASEKEFFAAKTPCRQTNTKTPTILEGVDGEPLSSPFQDVLDEAEGAAKLNARIPPPPALKPKPQALSERTKKTLTKPTQAKESPVPQGPIIKDAQCNPIDENIRNTILQNMFPPLSSYEGYHAHTNIDFGRGSEVRRFAKAVSKVNKNANEKTATNLSMPPVLKFDGSDRTYSIKRELGKGAFAPVYLVEGSDRLDEDIDDDAENQPARMGKGEFSIYQRSSLEAIKMESEPPSAWEFVMLRLTKRRLGVSRAAESIIDAYEMHLFRDEGFLVEAYRDQGTLLNAVNLARADLSSGGVLDEQLAMFFTVEILRTVESLHAKGIIHGDVKPDNILVRLDTAANDEWSSSYHPDGRYGWSSKGITLIDFGRGIDMKAFRPDVQFIADWPTTEADCAEMRELRPWTYQVDYHGLAGTIHTLLFGKYIETVAERGAALGAGATKKYRIREGLKRYWQTEIWADCFDLLLNPLSHVEAEEGKKLPVVKGMRGVRERMERYLADNGERGTGLKSLIRRIESGLKERKR